MYGWNDKWLELTTEDVIEPELAIIDPHHHLWEFEGWQRYMLDELQADTGSGHRVEATVFVECRSGYRTSGSDQLRPVGETEFVAEIAEKSVGRGAEIKGIVTFADMTLGAAVDEVLEAHVAAGRGRFRGIRHATGYDPDPRVRKTHTSPPPKLMADETFREGVRRLASFGLSFDAWLYHPQIPELTGLARAVPECTFVLDHLGGMLGTGPFEGKRGEILARWRDDIAELAACPNVNVKLGGIGMEVFGLGFEQWPAPPTSEQLVDAWGDPILYAIEQFGTDHSMFESNFPVDKASCSYRVLWNAFKRVASGFDPADKRLLFHDTAARVYQLS